jgi:hypothetical protein
MVAKASRAREARCGAIRFDAIESVGRMRDPVPGQHQARSGIAPIIGIRNAGSLSPRPEYDYHGAHATDGVPRT